MKLDLHIHSKYSYDSFSTPLKIAKVAKKRGLDVISITDHNTMGAYKNIPDRLNVVVIRGMEIKTDKGDVIGLFLDKEIKSRSFFEVIDEIREQDGIVVLPHPFRRNCNPKELVGHVGLVEVINARSRKAENSEAQKLCEKFNKKLITGSDAHTYFEIGPTYTEIEGFSTDLSELKQMILENERKCYGKESPFYVSHACSFATARFRRWCNL